MQPVILERDVLQSGYGIREFSWTPDYCEIYEVGVLSDQAPLRPGYNPGIRVRTRIASAAGILIAEIDRSKPARVALASSGGGAGKVSYGAFGVSKPGQRLTVTVEILQLDGVLMTEPPTLDLFVGVSGAP